MAAVVSSKDPINADNLIPTRMSDFIALFTRQYSHLVEDQDKCRTQQNSKNRDSVDSIENIKVTLKKAESLRSASHEVNQAEENNILNQKTNLHRTFTTACVSVLFFFLLLTAGLVLTSLHGESRYMALEDTPAPLNITQESEKASVDHRTISIEKPFATRSPFNALIFTGSSSADNMNCGPGWKFFVTTNSCYKVLQSSNFPDAELACQKLGAHLTSIHSYGENMFVFSLVTTGRVLDYDSHHDMTWIGFTANSSRDWSWTDGSSVDYVNWARNEPNNHKGNEHCTMMFADVLSRENRYENLPENYLRTWNDLHCDILLTKAVCKKAAVA